MELFVVYKRNLRSDRTVLQWGATIYTCVSASYLAEHPRRCGDMPAVHNATYARQSACVSCTASSSTTVSAALRQNNAVAARVQLRPIVLRLAAFPWSPSSSFTFSSRRSVTKRRRREFSSWSSRIWLVCSRLFGTSMRSTSLTGRGTGRANVPRAFRQRWYVITLTPNDLAMSPWSLPCAAISSAMASFVAISDAVCLCFVTILAPSVIALW